MWCYRMCNWGVWRIKIDHCGSNVNVATGSTNFVWDCIILLMTLSFNATTAKKCLEIWKFIWAWPIIYCTHSMHTRQFFLQAYNYCADSMLTIVLTAAAVHAHWRCWCSACTQATAVCTKLNSYDLWPSDFDDLNLWRKLFLCLEEVNSFCHAS